eukprot:755439-Hanusia_phi.AAC.1
MCCHCQARRRFVDDLEQDLISSRPNASAAIRKINEASWHANNVGKAFRQRLALLTAHYLLGLTEPPAPLVPSSMGSCYDMEKGLLNLSLKTKSMQRYIARELRVKSLPAWIARLQPHLEVIEVSGNPSLSLLPLEELCGMRALKEVRCKSCMRLSLPPPEIAEQGGEVVMTYLRRVRKDGKANQRMNLILIGSGEAGKTSVLRALMSEDSRAGKIDVEEGRTIGIDLHDWHPQGEEGLTFDVMDFGGQAVYGKSNQYFIVRRALYLLVWSVRRGEERDEQELRAMMSYWLRAIQARVPGASVMMVATHIDLAESSEALQQQCEEVKTCVKEELKKMLEDEDEMILPLHVLNDGVSFQVNCLRGDGIGELRKSVCGAAKSLLWWKELIPRAFLRLKEKVVESSRENPVIDIQQYISMVNAAEVDAKEMRIATTMLHEMGVLKYFGHKLETDGGGRDQGKYSVEDTVFIDPAWMIDVFKGVMRHDWRHLMDAFKDDSTRSKKLKKLLHLGIIDKDLFPYVWPQAGSDKAVALLQGCDLAHFLGAGPEAEQEEGKRELLCPGIIPTFVHQHKQAVYDKSSLCWSMEHEYNIFPAGFIDRLVVRSAAGHFDVDCSGTMAVMRGWGRMLVLSWRSDEDKHTLIAHTSTEQQMENLRKDLEALQAFFPGMRRRKGDEKSSGSTAVQVGIFTCGEQSGEAAREIEKRMKEIHRDKQAPLDLTCVVRANISQVSGNILLHVLCISTECLDQEGRLPADSAFFQLWNQLTASRAIVIPVVLTDYQEEVIAGPNRFNEWWPEGIQGMERYKIFHEYKQDEMSMRKLYETITMKLHQGRGSYEDLMDVTSQNALLCPDCFKKDLASGDAGDTESGSNSHRDMRGIQVSAHVARIENAAAFDLSKLKQMRQDSAIGLQVECSRHHKVSIREVLEFNSSVAPC